MTPVDRAHARPLISPHGPVEWKSVDQDDHRTGPDIVEGEQHDGSLPGNGSISIALFLTGVKPGFNRGSSGHCSIEGLQIQTRRLASFRELCYGKMAVGKFEDPRFRRN